MHQPRPPVKDIVADICRPGIIIWNRIRRKISISSRVKNVIENEYFGIGFPDHECFGDLVLLVRKL
ncbi:hypothetical protein F4678DRAFT_416646, partial [Xylaria arbuscula]